VHSGTSGGPPPQLFLQQTQDYFPYVTDGILRSLVTSCHRAAPLMLKRGGGAIVWLGSDAAKIPTPGQAVIGAGLAGAAMFIRTLAVELAGRQIRANAVTPSIVAETASYQRAMSGEHSRRIFTKAIEKAKLGVP